MREELAAWVRRQGSTPAARARAARQLFDGLCEDLLADAPDTDHLSAPNAVVEVVDAETGQLYRRYFEIEYEENDNGVRMIGEDMAGSPVQMVFLSEAALKKMHELRGNGPDAPRCDSDS